MNKVMDVAGQKLCHELYELSGWKDTYWKYVEVDPDNWRLCTDSIKWLKSPDNKSRWIPAYDLGFLLRRLSNVEVGNDTDNSKDGQYYAKRPNSTGRVDSNDKAGNLEFADTPEDAAAKLAIGLIKQGILPAAPKQTKEEIES